MQKFQKLFSDLFSNTKCGNGDLKNFDTEVHQFFFFLVIGLKLHVRHADPVGVLSVIENCMLISKHLEL